MDRLIYVSMSGANNIMAQQTIKMNNLANVSATGFRADLQNYESVAEKGDGLPTRVYGVESGVSFDATQGPIMTTSRDLDVAVNGDGWFAVATPDGREKYTRAGNFEVNQSGELVLPNGYKVLGDGGPITLPPSTSVSIANNGAISIQPKGQPATVSATVGRLKLVKPDTTTMQKSEDGFLVLKSGANAESDATVSVTSGALEGSNVNAVGTLIDIVSLAREFELQMKIMKDAENSDQQTARIMQL